MKKRVFIILVIFFTGISSNLLAQEIPQPTPFQGGGLNSFTPFQFFSQGEAVNLVNGNLTLNYTDGVVPGRNGLNVAIQRTFNIQHGVEPVEIDRKFRTGYFDEDRDGYTFGSYINLNYTCAFAKIHSALYRNDSITCSTENGAYVDQMVLSALQPDTAPSLSDIAYSEYSLCDEHCEPQFGWPYPVLNPVLDEGEFGVVESRDDRLDWSPPSNRWTISASPYVGLVSFTNVFPLDREGQMITFLIRSDGGIEAFDNEGNKLTDVDGSQMYLAYFSGNRYISNALSTSDSVDNPDEVDISEALEYDLTHNTSIEKNITSIQIGDENERLYIFDRFKTHTALVHINMVGHRTIAPIRHVPYWRIDFFRPAEIRDRYQNTLRWSYPSDSRTVVTDSLNREIVIERVNNGVQVRLPASNRERAEGRQERVWQYDMTGQGLERVVDPEGNETRIYYNHPDRNSPPIVRRFPRLSIDIDQFLEIHYPTGGVTRYELYAEREFEPRSRLPISLGAFVTEFPDSHNANDYYQKLIQVVKNPDVRPSTNAITTTVYEVDGSVYTYDYRNFIFDPTNRVEVPLLTRRVLDAGSGNTITEDYEWSMTHRGNGKYWLNGIEEITTTRGATSYRTTMRYNDRGLVESMTDSMRNRTLFEYDPYVGEIIKSRSFRSRAAADDTDTPVVFDRSKDPRTIKKITRFLTRESGEEPDRIETIFYRTGADLCGTGGQQNGQQNITSTQVNKIHRRVNDGQEQVVREYCFDSHGNIVEVRNPTGDDTIYHYNSPSFRPYSVEKGDQTTTYSFDPYTGNITSKTGSNGETRSYTYDSLNRLTGSSFQNGSYLAHSYQFKNNIHSPSGENAIVTNTNDAVRNEQHSITRVYDGLGLLKRAVRDGRETRYEYGWNKKIAEIHAPGSDAPWQFQYDGLGRLTDHFFPGGESLSYNYSYTLNEGQLSVEKTDIFNGDTLLRSIYKDTLGRVVRVDQMRDDSLLTSNYDYNEVGLLLEAESPSGLITRNIFDDKLRLVGRQYPGGDSIDFYNVSNEDGILDQIILQDSQEGSISGILTYDSNRRVTLIDYPSTNGNALNDYSFVYAGNDAAPSERGRLIELTDPSGTSEFTYDVSGETVEIEREVGPLEISYLFQYGHDAFGNDYLVGYPNGLNIYYVTDSQGRLAEVRENSMSGPLIASFGYDDQENVDSVQFGNGVETTYAYDPSGRVLAIRISKGGELLSQVEYDYDDLGNKAEILYADNSRVNFDYIGGTHWTKKAEYFREGDSTPYNTQNYTYDDEGNRLTYSDATKSITYQRDLDEGGSLRSNKVVGYNIGSHQEGILEYDVRGNLIRQIEKLKEREVFRKEFSYDYQDRLVSVQVEDSAQGYQSTNEYAYDYASRRTKKTSDGNTTYYLYGKSIEPMMELDENGDAKRIFIYAGGRKIAAYYGENILYYHGDELGNTLNLTDDQGNVAQTLRYDPFGNVNFESSAVENPYQFAGKEKDESTGLVYFGARYYDPVLGRFITRDPAEDGLNHYLYAQNNPTTRREIFGLTGGSPSPDGGFGDVGDPGYGGGFETIDVWGGGGGMSGDFETGFPGSSVGNAMFSSFFGGLFSAITGTPVNPLNQTMGSMNEADSSDWEITVCLKSKGKISCTGGSHGNPAPEIDTMDDWISGGGGGFPDGSSDTPPGEGFDMGDPGIDPYDYSPPVNTEPLNNGSPTQITEIESFSTPGINQQSLPINIVTTSSTNIQNRPPSVQLGESPFNLALGAAESSGASGFTGGSTPPPVEDSSLEAGGMEQETDTPDSGPQETASTEGNPNIGDDPVLLSSGDLLQVETDLRIPGRGFDFEFTRTYRSRVESLGSLGHGWDHNYNKRLFEQEDGDVVRRDGKARYDIYKRQEDGSYTSPVGYFDLLTKNGDGTFEIQDRSETVYSYDAEGFITSIRDRNNNEMSFNYTGSDSSRRLFQVVDTLGRIITYSYYTSGTNEGRLRRIEDFTGRRVVFGYDENNDLTSVTSPSTEDYPSGKTVTYTYSSGYAEANNRLNHNLLTVTDAKGQTFLENDYSSSDRVERQTFGDGSFNYEYFFQREWADCGSDSPPSTNTAVSRTVIIDRVGNQTEYQFNCQGNYLQSTEYTRGLRADDPDAFVTQYEYNRDGQITQVTLPEGNETRYEYNEGAGTNSPARGNLLSVTRVPDADRGGSAPLVTSFTYEPSFNQIETITDPQGGTVTHIFDDNGNIRERHLPQVTLADDSTQSIQYTYTYNDHGQITSITQGEGNVDRYEYYPSGPQKGYLQRITRDLNDEAIPYDFTYDGAGNIVSFTDGRRNTYTFDVNELNQVIRMVTPAPISAETRIVYDANNNLEQVEVQNKDQDGTLNPDLPWITTTYAYNLLDRLVSRTQTVAAGDEVLTEYQYDLNENLTRVIQPEGNSIRLHYDERDLPFRIIRGFGSTDASETIVSYDENGNLKSSRNARSFTTTYHYDGFDRLVQITDPLANTTHVVYDPNNNLTQIRRRGPPHGETETHVLLSEINLVYDELNRLIQRKNKLLDDSFNPVRDITTLFGYDQNNRITRVQDDNDHAASLTYDGLNRLINILDPVGNETTYTYGDRNNITQVTTREPHPDLGIQEFVSSYEYDVINRPTKATDNNEHEFTYAYDSRGNLVEATDPKNAGGLDSGANSAEGNKIRITYDGLNRPRSVIRELRTDGIGNGSLVDEITTQYLYDDNGLLISLTDSNNNSTEYFYDDLNRKTATFLPDNSIYTFGYDPLDNLTHISDPNGFEITSVYDCLNRLVEKEITRGGLARGSETFEYDGLSRMTKAENEDSEGTSISQVIMKYNSLNRLIEEIQNGRSVRTQFDGVGNLKNLIYPSGREIENDYDELNRLTSITDPAVGELINTNYAGFYRPVHRNYMNGLETGLTYDNLKRLTRLTHVSPAGMVAGFEYGFDAAGQRLYDRYLHGAGRSNVYQYDSDYRLTQAKTGVPDPVAEIGSPGSETFTLSQTWTIDKVNNWLTKVEDLSADPGDETSTSYGVNNLNQVTDISGTDIVYDDSGNLTDDGTYTYAYDYRNLLTTVSDKASGQPIVNYVYDALGRRISKTVVATGETTQFIYNGAEVIEDRNGSGSVVATYVYGQGLDEVVSMERDGAQYFYHSDFLGSPVAITNESGNIIERYEYDPYGNVVIRDPSDEIRATSIINNRHLYTGREYEPEVGLYYYRNRYYHPTLGRFLQRDPIGYYDGMNLYAYVGNDPMNWIDPWGFYQEDVHRGLSEYLAGRAGFSQEEARLIGEYAQRPDERFTSTPVFTAILDIANDPLGINKWSHGKRSLEKWHFPMNRGATEVVPGNNASRKVMDRGIKNKDLKEFALGLHPFQDSWSHQGKPYLGRGYGHPKERGGWTSPHADLTYLDPISAYDMAENIYEELLGFRRGRGDITEDQYRDLLSQWPGIAEDIQDFINASTPGEKIDILREWDVTPNNEGTWDMNFGEEPHPKKD